MHRARSLCNASSTDAQNFEIPARYRFAKLLGNGSYGVVAAFYDSVRGRDVAVKRVRRVFDNFLVLRRTLREIRLMRHFKHPNVLRLYKALPIENEGGDVYLSMELMDCDLDSLIHARQVSIAETQAMGFAAQILLGLMHMHAGGVIHRDLKPANIFVRLSRNIVKIGDLGLSRGIVVDESTGEATHPSDEMLTEYVVTRWYRSPEVLLARSKYGPPVDVWSVGCILYEIIMRKALFPGKNSYDQLRRIMAVIGNPSDSEASWVPPESRPLLQRCCQPEQVGEKGGSQRTGWNHSYLPYSVPGNELLCGMCRFDPSKRLTIEKCLASQYLAGLTTPQDIELARRTAPADVSYDRSFDGIGRTGESAALMQLGRMLRKEVSSEHEDITPTPEVSPRGAKPGNLQRQGSVSSARSMDKQSVASSQRESSTSARGLPFQSMVSLDFLLGHRGSGASASVTTSTAASTSRTEAASESKSARRDTSEAEVRRSSTIRSSEAELSKSKNKLLTRQTPPDESTKREPVESEYLQSASTSRATTIAAPVRRPDVRLDKFGKAAWSGQLSAREEGEQDNAGHAVAGTGGTPSPATVASLPESSASTSAKRQSSATRAALETSAARLSLSRRRGASSRGPSVRTSVPSASGKISIPTLESSGSLPPQALQYRQQQQPRNRTPPRAPRASYVRQSTPPRGERTGPAAAASLSMTMSQPIISDSLQDRSPAPSTRADPQRHSSSRSFTGSTMCADPSPATTRTPGSGGSLQSQAPDSNGSFQSHGSGTSTFNGDLCDHSPRSAFSEKETSRVFLLLDEMLQSAHATGGQPNRRTSAGPAVGAATSRGASTRFVSKATRTLDHSAERSHPPVERSSSQHAKRVPHHDAATASDRRSNGSGAHHQDELDFATVEAKQEVHDYTPRRAAAAAYHAARQIPTPLWLERHERTPRGSLKHAAADISPVRTPRSSRCKTASEVVGSSGTGSQSWRSLYGTGAGSRVVRGTPPRSRVSPS